MAYDIRRPKATGRTDNARIDEIHSYLCQTAEELSWALNDIEGKLDSASSVNNTGTAEEQKDIQRLYGEIKSLRLKVGQIADHIGLTLN